MNKKNFIDKSNEKIIKEMNLTIQDYNGKSIMSLYPTPVISETYNKDTVILFKNENPTDDDIKTKIFSTENLINFDDFVNYPVKDVAYQASDGTNDTTIPTYYGDGTQWVKFKN